MSYGCPTKTWAEGERWLTIFRQRRDDLLDLLQAHHYKNPYAVSLHANGRARDAIEDGCRVAEAVMMQRPLPTSTTGASGATERTV